MTERHSIIAFLEPAFLSRKVYLVGPCPDSSNLLMRAKQRHALIAVLGENSKDLGNCPVRPPLARHWGFVLRIMASVKQGGYLSSWVSSLPIAWRTWSSFFMRTETVLQACNTVP